ncbi:MAG: hypothetical protein NTV49_05420 [Kiritimatiellaeota bacterium]|nr:hypothetical protein [Kiritimatiellota bacterium]
MSFNLYSDLFLNVAAPGGAACLLEGKTSSTRQVKPSFMQADCFPLNLYFRTPGTLGSNSTAVELAALTIVLGAKALDDLDAATLLFSASGFVAIGEGDELHYQAVLDLNTAEIVAALGSAKSMTARVNVEVETAGNAQRLTYQFDVTIQAQAYGGEAAPTPGTPIYPHPSLLLTKVEAAASYIPIHADQARVRWNPTTKDLEFYCDELGKYAPLLLVVRDGVLVVTPGEPVDV